MAPEFGTSGLRGPAAGFTAGLVAEYLRAFLAVCDPGRGLWLGRDRRASSPAIAGWVAAAARGAGVAVTDCGVLPTPALALAAGTAGAAAVMVTGSHIPAERNGIKFYTPRGEITKADEAAIGAAIGAALGRGRAAARPGPPPVRGDAGAAYLGRMVAGFGPRALAGRRIGVWTHSAAGRELLCALVAALGAEVVELGRSAGFVALDTEAVDGATRARLAGWARDHALDAVVSTDGDGDRPLLADAAGQLVAGDVLGQIAAAALGAEVVVTPVSSNTGAEAGGRFARVVRTRIGSPHVIAAMAAEMAAGAGTVAGPRVAGYEANGGFLLGFTARGPAGPVPPLMTRDAVLPVVAALCAARARGTTLAGLVAGEPARATAAGRLCDVPAARSRALIARIARDGRARAAFLAACGAGDMRASDRTDGLRMICAGGAIVHLRPSGNAPELRLYTEAGSPGAARALCAAGLAALGRALAAGNRRGRGDG